MDLGRGIHNEPMNIFILKFTHSFGSLRLNVAKSLTNSNFTEPAISDGHERRYFFGSGSAAAFFRHQRQAAALQRPILSKYSAAAATANKLLLKLFQFTFSHVTVWSLYSPLVFTRLLRPRYFSLVEHTRLPM